MEKFKKFVKDNEQEIIVSTFNVGLADMFYEKQGNFTLENEDYEVPQLVKK